MFAFAGTAVFGTLFGSTAEPGPVILFGALTALYARFGATGVYTYTPELYPPEIRARSARDPRDRNGIASGWRRVGSITLLLIVGIFAVAKGKLMLFLVADGILLGAALMVLLFGPPSRGRPLEELEFVH